MKLLALRWRVVAWLLVIELILGVGSLRDGTRSAVSDELPGIEAESRA